MNCLIVLFKPGVHFSCVKEIKDILELNLPKYSYELDDWTSIDIDQCPFPASIEDPFFQLESDVKKFLHIPIYLRNAWLYEDDFYIRLKEFVGEICTALKSDEWWYTSEMQCDHYEELTIEGIETALNEEEHTVEHAIKRLGGSFKATQLWFEHDTIKHTLLH